MITGDRTNTDVLVKIPNDAGPPGRLNAFLDWLRLEEITQRSKLTTEGVTEIADQVKADWWAADQARFIPQSEL